MGLRANEDCTDQGLDWDQPLPEPSKPPFIRRQHQKQQQQQQSEPLKCPRCGSDNTKFCYYNNYNKSQPRHFCKSCKRHWTKGGTLRNVPVGGVRKSKRPGNKSNAATANTAAITGACPAAAEPARCQNRVSLLPSDNESMPLSGVLRQAFGYSNITDTMSLHESSAKGGIDMIGVDKPFLDQNLSIFYPPVNDHPIDQYPAGINPGSNMEESSGNCDMISTTTSSWTSLNMSCDVDCLSNNWNWNWNCDWNGIDDVFGNSSDLNIAWDDFYAEAKP